MKSYLSIDLDYWFCKYPTEHCNTIKLLNLLCYFRHKDKNCLIVDEHHNLLDHINESDTDNIIHIDYHQDLCWYEENSNPKVECGNFFWFVDGKENKKFKWFYPDTDECIKNAMGLCMDPSYKPLSKKNFIFNNQTRKCGLPTKQELETVTDIGISFSLDYLNIEGRMVDFINTVTCINGVFGLRSEVKNLFTNYGDIDVWEDGQEFMRRMKW